ncbi:hypothetical protein GCK72_021117 [Caenorhabditis remanei]|uniref:F-box domain-containing protein n=1 Tax=Caenorhabditis remanei TaxID=31234 RepID=A0A6A5GID8_CAERE|nr:hypothetical protein GCK72_021117 [Caenorhabditis remanei]KAF1754554.1 hypothetical protein GCK72_021117 [Caenorhabditis remanei]
MTPFPLLRLPRLALIPVFQHMEPSEIIAFSLLSNRAKNLVKMLWKPSVKTISFLVVSNDLSILAYLSNYDKPLRLHIKTKTVNGMIPLSKWLERVLDVLNSYSIFQINLHGSPQLEVCDALAILKEVRHLYIMANCPNSFAKKALEILTPVTTETVMFKIPFESQEELEIFMKSNRKYLSIFIEGFSELKFNMDAFLVSNSLRLSLREKSLSARRIKQFLSNWLQNEHNSPLEHLTMIIDESVDRLELLEGLDAVPFSEKRTFHYSKDLEIPPNTFSGGYDVRGMNGKDATITFEGGYQRTRFDFYVWN